MGAAPSHDLLDRGHGGGPVPAYERELGPHHHLTRTDVGMAVRQRQALGGVLSGLPRGQIEYALTGQHGGRVRAVPAGVHAQRPTHRAGYTDGPFEAHQSGGGRAAGDDGEQSGGTGAHRRAGDGDCVETGARHDHEPVESGVGHQHVRTVAEHEHRHGRTGTGESAVHGGEVVLPAHLRALARIDGEVRHRVERRVGGGPAARRVHHAGSTNSSSGNEVRSPAPRVRHRSPARSTRDRRLCTSARPGT